MDSEDEDDDLPVRIPIGHPPVLFALPGSEDLTQKVLAHLNWPPGACQFKTFDNGEISVRADASVSNHDVFIIYARNDSESEVNFSLMRLLLFLDAVRGESAHRITVVLPCLEYARQDRRTVAGECIPPKLLLRCMQAAGAHRFLTVDLHNGAEAAFCPRGAILDELSADRYITDFLLHAIPAECQSSISVCATVGGGIRFARQLASDLGAGFMMADRFRSKGGGGAKESLRIISDSDVSQATAVVVIDDMFDTCRSLAEVCHVVHKSSPRARLYAVASHGYFSGEAHLQIRELVDECGLEWLGVANTIAQDGILERLSAANMGERLKVIDVSRVIAGAICRIHLGTSVNLPNFRRLGPDDQDSVLSGFTVKSHPHGVQVNRYITREENLFRQLSR